jgi:hypothetical protein
VVVRTAEPSNVPPVLVEVRVSSEQGLLWQGQLRVGASGANIVQSRTESEMAGCQTSDRHDRSLRNHFHLNLNRRYGVARDGDAAYALRLSWSRPASSQGCAANGSRTVEISQSLDLPAGGQATLRGDAGLVVTLRRR